jgi:hypothetical protein
MKFEPPLRRDFEPHPAGNHTGTITEIRDHGMMESLYKDAKGNTKEVHRIGIVITSDTATMDGGEPFSHQEFCNISFAPKSRLTELRNMLRDRDLTNDELNEAFDSEVEFEGRKVRYKIRHELNDKTGKTRATIRDWEYADGEAPDLKNTEQADAQEAVEKAFDGKAVDDDLPF